MAIVGSSVVVGKVAGGVGHSPWAWAIVGYYGVVVTVVAFLLWARGVARVPASAASVFTGVLPVSALALSHAGRWTKPSRRRTSWRRRGSSRGS